MPLAEDVQTSEKLDYSQVLYNIVMACNESYIMGDNTRFIRSVHILEAILPMIKTDKDYQFKYDELASIPKAEITSRDKGQIANSNMVKNLEQYFSLYSLLIEFADKKGLLMAKFKRGY